MGRENPLGYWTGPKHQVYWAQPHVKSGAGEPANIDPSGRSACDDGVGRRIASHLHTAQSHSKKKNCTQPWPLQPWGMWNFQSNLRVIYA